MLALRKQAYAAGAAEAAEAVVARFFDAVAVVDGEEIAAYRPIRSELDPTPLMRALYCRGARLSVPVIEAKGAPLRFMRWTPDAQMVVGPFGAEVPEAGDEVAPSLFLTPLVAFSSKGARLGYGGGFYDRTFAAARLVRRIRTVGLAFSCQQASEIPQEPTDQPLDAVITEQEALIFDASAMALPRELG